MTGPAIADDVHVLIVADDPLARTGLATLLSSQPGCAVVGQVAGQTDWPTEFEVYRPNVIVWDLGWEAATSLERQPDLRELGLPVVVLVTDGVDAADAWAAGARGLLLREVNADSLAAALRTVVWGLVALDPSLAAGLLPAGDRTPGHLVEELTPRELEVLQLLADGRPNKAIGQKLGISEHTVKFHVNAILSKLSAQSRTEAVVRATRLGLIIL